MSICNNQEDCIKHHEQLDSLRQRVAELEAENEELLVEPHSMCCEWRVAEVEAKLAASQHYAQQLREVVEILWSLLDDIDTFSDMAKSDDAAYRKMVEAKQAQRWVRTGITTDGYTLDLHIPHDTSALDTLVKDAERLDFLDSLCLRKDNTLIEGINGLNSDMHFSTIGVSLHMRDCFGKVVNSGSGDVRAAIDAAMKGQE